MRKTFFGTKKVKFAKLGTTRKFGGSTWTRMARRWRMKENIRNTYIPPKGETYFS